MSTVVNGKGRSDGGRNRYELEETAWFQNEVDEEVREIDSTDKVNVSRAQHVSDLHSNFALGPHHCVEVW